MKHLVLAACVTVLCVAPACAQPAPVPAPVNVCLQINDIDRTSVPDARTILFHMKDGRIWKNALVGACPELRFNGFEYVSQPDNEICGNLQSIRVLHSGAVCLLGPFTPYTPGAKN